MTSLDNNPPTNMKENIEIVSTQKVETIKPKKKKRRRRNHTKA